MLHHNVASGVIISNQSLVLQGVSRATAGNYTCVGYNTEGDGESNAFYLNVLCKYTVIGKKIHLKQKFKKKLTTSLSSQIPVAPTCKPNQTKIYGVAKKERANIVCQVDANPNEVQFKWTFNNSADSVDVSSSRITNTGTSSVVSYTPSTELDYGTLLCYASNKIGLQRVPCVFHIIAAGE